MNIAADGFDFVGRRGIMLRTICRSTGINHGRCEMGMDKSFRDILFGQEREDDMSTRSEEDMTAAVRGNGMIG